MEPNLNSRVAAGSRKFRFWRKTWSRSAPCEPPRFRVETPCLVFRHVGPLSAHRHPQPVHNVQVEFFVHGLTFRDGFKMNQPLPIEETHRKVFPFANLHPLIFCPIWIDCTTRNTSFDSWLHYQRLVEPSRMYLLHFCRKLKTKFRAHITPLIHSLLPLPMATSRFTQVPLLLRNDLM